MRNTCDKNDIVRQEAILRAGPLKMAAYRVRDVETGEFSLLQFHATFDNTVLAVMGEYSARAFANFVRKTLGEDERFFLAQDDDCHWYVIPVSKEDEWAAWRNDPNNEDVPDFAEPVGGAPSLITFEDPK